MSKSITCLIPTSCNFFRPPQPGYGKRGVGKLGRWPEDGCACRKPAAGMIEQAASDLGFQPDEAFFIGDKTCDIDAGRAANATTLLVRTGYGGEHETDKACRPDFVVDDLASAAAVIQQTIVSSTATMDSSFSTTQDGIS